MKTLAEVETLLRKYNGQFVIAAHSIIRTRDYPLLDAEKNYCPLTLIAHAELEIDFQVSQATEAGEALDIPVDISNRIISGADNDKVSDREWLTSLLF